MQIHLLYAAPCAIGVQQRHDHHNTFTTHGLCLLAHGGCQVEHGQQRCIEHADLIGMNAKAEPRHYRHDVVNRGLDGRVAEREVFGSDRIELGVVFSRGNRDRYDRAMFIGIADDLGADAVPGRTQHLRLSCYQIGPRQM